MDEKAEGDEEEEEEEGQQQLQQHLPDGLCVLAAALGRETSRCCFFAT